MAQMSGAGGLLYGEHENSAKESEAARRKFKKSKRDAKKAKKDMLNMGWG